MELWEIIIELLLGCIDLSGIICDVVCWIKGKDNRIQRRTAKLNNYELPKRDKWNTWAIVIAIIVIPLTGYLVSRFLFR